MSYYAPLNVLKPIGDDIWIVDGPAISFYGLPFSTRMTVIRLKNGDVFLHSPTKFEPELMTAIDEIGPVEHLVSPNWIHYAYIGAWAEVYPEAVKWASPNVQARANKTGVEISFDRDLGPEAPADWAEDIEQMLVEGNKFHREVVFFHKTSKTLVLTDLIENFEAQAVPFWFRPIAWVVGILDPDGKMPADMWMTFRKRKSELRTYVERMIALEPEYVVLAHGRCYDSNCAAELRRAFRKAL